MIIKNKTLGNNSSTPYCHHQDEVWLGATILRANPYVRAAKTNSNIPLHNANLTAKAGGAAAGVLVDDVCWD